ncbi:PREDICTED: LOB domain-containing protein 29-like isoform X2 [Lupinus angustifolius]|uniref:LOB domain-containing protein 29-like isoform X2 n=1 Tax=Lupinus angustifolius TaxID=3871 RepID=UPI00092F9653|nr:PREDICTED: LOB domain-containing protein 29-like isoform X2 [Lupinus angustifolius]
MSGSPCGACKFLRRKCVKGCVFAPYFCHEQGATHFAAIHKVFGASNVSKLLTHLPVINLQAQLSYLKEQAAPSCLNASANEKYFEKPTTNSFPQDLQSWFHQVENSNPRPEFVPNLSHNSSETQCYVNNNTVMDLSPVGNYENSGMSIEESSSFSSFDESSNTMSYNNMQTDRGKWAFHDVDDLHSIAFGYNQSYYAS